MRYILHVVMPENADKMLRAVQGAKDGMKPGDVWGVRIDGVFFSVKRNKTSFSAWQVPG